MNQLMTGSDKQIHFFVYPGYVVFVNVINLQVVYIT